jgi:DNA-binding response OmpR family regulator
MNDNRKGKILFVDNDPDTCETMSTMLGRAGYQVVVAGGMPEGFRYAQKQYFDLILLNLCLEEGTGVDLCRWIRRIDEETPIFFYTSIDNPQEIKTALEAGAQGYFIKPVDIGNLLDGIDSRVKGSQQVVERPSV